MIADDDLDRARAVAGVARQLEPDALIIGRGRNAAEAEALLAAGAHTALADDVESAATIAERVLETLMVDAATSDALIGELQGAAYRTAVGGRARSRSASASSSPRRSASRGAAGTPARRRWWRRGARAAPNAWRRQRVGPPAHLHDLRPRRLLRHVASPPRARPLERERPSTDEVGRTRGGLGMVLHRRGGALTASEERELAWPDLPLAELGRHLRHRPSLDPGDRQGEARLHAVDQPLLARHALRHRAGSHHRSDGVRSARLPDRPRLHQPRAGGERDGRTPPRVRARAALGGRLLRRADGGARRARAGRRDRHPAQRGAGRDHPRSSTTSTRPTTPTPPTSSGGCWRRPIACCAGSARASSASRARSTSSGAASISR